MMLTNGRDAKTLIRQMVSFGIVVEFYLLIVHIAVAKKYSY